MRMQSSLRLMPKNSTASITSIGPCAQMQTVWAGRAFHFRCGGGQSYKESAAEGYDVFLSHNGRESQCSCMGFASGPGKPCKHFEVVRAILENGWMDCPVDLDADMSRTEIDDQPE